MAGSHGVTSYKVNRQRTLENLPGYGNLAGSRTMSKIRRPRLRKPLVFPGQDEEGSDHHLDRLAGSLGSWELKLQGTLAATVHTLHKETALLPTTSTAPRCRRQRPFPKHNRLHEAASVLDSFPRTLVVREAHKLKKVDPVGPQGPVKNELRGFLIDQFLERHATSHLATRTA